MPYGKKSLKDKLKTKKEDPGKEDKSIRSEGEEKESFLKLLRGISGGLSPAGRWDKEKTKRKKPPLSK